jgi:cytochrome c553
VRLSFSGRLLRARCRCAKRAAATLSLLLIATSSWAGARAPVPTAAGEAIYRTGALSSGEPLRGERGSTPGVRGAAAACINCHRRSGLGEVEGQALVPPITAKYLYRPRTQSRPGILENNALTMAEPGVRPELLRQAERSAYTDATLARAIRDGVAPDGRQLDVLMPRYPIGDADMASLIAYLKQLSRRPSPGVGDVTLQFATIITPEADPIQRQGMLDVLEHFFGKHNVWSSVDRPIPQLSRRFNPIAHRWQLHIWELSGGPDSWEGQLDQRLKREPVFAAISGIGGKTWEPVHRFCERSRLPCLFPNVDLPVIAEQDFYDVYFTKGVLLEAQLIAQRVQAASDSGAGAPTPRRLVQAYRRGDIGEKAADELRRALAPGVVQAVDRALEADAGPSAVQKALSDIGVADALVLWLRPGDIGSLPQQPPAAAAVFLSGIMGGLENTPLPSAWRGLTRIAYPFDLPERRKGRMNYPLGWMRFKQIPVVDERTQTDTYLACMAVAETVSMMGEDLVRDHLVETLELHLGTRLVNGYYPRLGLAAGQRFASKGGFVVRFADPQGTRVVADGDWSVP